MPDGGIVPGYMTLDVEKEIANWSAWSRTRRGVAHCASIESNYRPPKYRVSEPGGIAVDVNSALSVERAMCLVPRQHQLAIIWHYVWLAPSPWICRKLSLKHPAWPQFLDDARAMLTNLLLRQGKWRIHSGYNSTPASS